MTRRHLLVLGLLLLAAPRARADLFSPGDLAKAHATVEGIANCTKCHPKGQQLSQEACIVCHEELRGRLAESRGYHGRLKGKDRDCWACHHEHQGRDFAMLDWTAGGNAGGKKGFDHARTGYPLKGKHAGVDCEKCHDRRLIADPVVKSMLEKQPTRTTMLGAPVACASCHADEHRGQVGTDCQKCHTEASWKPATQFDHAKTGYPLLGRHQKVACDKCHVKVADPVEHTGLLKPKNRTFLKMKPVQHQNCLDCHKDPHQNRFGEDCKKCHTEADWKLIVTGATEARSFHDKTRYKLEGAHASVTCKACHGPNPGVPAQFKDLPFAHCTDCHVDAHAGQMKRRAPDGGRCERCHTVQSFEAVRFGPEEHAKESRYPLEGAHKVVACAACHVSDPRVGDRFPTAAREELQRRGRPVRVALAVYNFAGDLTRCETCHADPHHGQFDKRAAGKGCTACHELASFTKTKFDHAKDTKFPLEGKHLKTACASCHPTVRGAQGAIQVKYAGVETACAGCHADVHGAQFAPRASEVTDCARCHSAEDWKKALRFRHEPPFTEFKLVGKHVKVKCEACHPEAREVKLAGEVKLRKYRKVPVTCQGCHVDFHKGAFRGYEP